MALTFPCLSHHAYLLIGDDAIRTDLISILEKKHKIKVHGNPDFIDQTFTTFTIENARDLKSLASTRPVGAAGKKIFIVTMNGITVEAQNALLKLLEEPAESTHFFLIIPSAHLLLPTVKSRLSLIGSSQGSSETDLTEARHFVKSTPAKRLEAVKSLLDDISKEKKFKQDAVNLLNGIEAVIYEDRGVKEGKQALQAIDMARKYLSDRAPSVKMLLEYVALNLG